jgi:hypothetical protein
MRVRFADVGGVGGGGALVAGELAENVGTFEDIVQLDVAVVPPMQIVDIAMEAALVEGEVVNMDAGKGVPLE